MVDVISKGRLECGFVRSVPYEIAPANSIPVRMAERMWEAHDLIVKAWTSHDGPFTFEGEFFHHRMVNIWPRPYQKPHPPIWVTALSTGNASEIARKGYNLGTFLGGYEKTPPVFKAYRKAYREAGTATTCRSRNSAIVVSSSSEKLKRKAVGGQHLLWYLSHNKLPMHFRNPPGYASIEANVMALKGRQIGVRREGWVPDPDEEMGKASCFAARRTKSTTSSRSFTITWVGSAISCRWFRPAICRMKTPARACASWRPNFIRGLESLAN